MDLCRQSNVSEPLHTQIYTHTHTHKCIHTYTHTYMYVQTYSYAFPLQIYTHVLHIMSSFSLYYKWEYIYIYIYIGHPDGPVLKNLLAIQEMWLWSLAQEVSLEKEMDTHFSILAWEIPWTAQAWRTAVHGIAKSQAWLSNWTNWTELSMRVHTIQTLQKHI